MKVKVDPEICVGHGRCYDLAPEVFDDDNDRGHALTHGEEIPPELEAKARRAAANCPERAISLEAD
jgi:ferredoxin